MTIKGLTKKLEQLHAETEQIVSVSISTHVVQLGILNKQQLLTGKRRDGQDLSPTYFEDPYFETIQQATAYSEWKDRITPNPKRRSGVPNLFINGYYHDSREVIVLTDRIIYTADYKGVEIEQKYGEEINGLGGDFKEAFLSIHVRPFLNTKITSIIGLKFQS